jgi:hypothetical protein
MKQFANMPDASKASYVQMFLGLRRGYLALCSGTVSRRGATQVAPEARAHRLHKEIHRVSHASRLLACTLSRSFHERTLST